MAFALLWWFEALALAAEPNWREGLILDCRLMRPSRLLGLSATTLWKMSAQPTENRQACSQRCLCLPSQGSTATPAGRRIVLLSPGAEGVLCMSCIFLEFASKQTDCCLGPRCLVVQFDGIRNIRPEYTPGHYKIQVLLQSSSPWSTIVNPTGINSFCISQPVQGFQGEGLGWFSQVLVLVLHRVALKRFSVCCNSWSTFPISVALNSYSTGSDVRIPISLIWNSL